MIRGSAGWLALGVALGIVSFVGPEGVLLTLVGLGLVIGLKPRSAAPGLVLIGTGAITAVFFGLFQRSYPTAPFAVGLGLCTLVLVAGAAWVYVHIRRRKLGVPFISGSLRG